MIAAHVVFRAIEKGHGELREIDDNWLKLYYNLLQRIRRRTPCLAMSGNVQCSEEMQTHAEQHRFGGTKKRSGVHQFTDPQSDKELEQVFRDTISMFQQLAAKGGPAAVAAVHKARLKVFQDAISTHSTAPQKQCALCFKNRSDCLLSCEHAFCTQCMDGLKNSATAELACPLCTKDVHIIENVPKLPGRYGVRILCLEGGGVRGPVSLKSLRRLEHVTGMQIGDMFDIVCGTGAGGVVAATVGSGKLSLDQCEELFHSLSESVFQKPRMGHRVFNVGFLQSIFGKPYSASSFEEVLQTHLGDGSFLDGERRGEPRSPKVFALAGATSPHFEPYILGNYPPGKRDKPTVSCLYKLWEVCRATMSTPKFFAPFDKSGTLLVDGAVFANNPAEIAIAEANIIWNFPDIDLVVSVGCGLTGARDGDDEGGDEEEEEAASSGSGRGGGGGGDDDDNASDAGGKQKKTSSGSSAASKKAAKAAAAKAAKAAKAPKGPKGDCKFTFGQEVVDLAETGESVHNNMRQVLKENEKYVRLEPTLSKPSAASTDAKQLRQMAAEAEAWVNDNDAKFLVARQRLLAKGLYVDGAGAFRCVVGETASFEVRRKRGLAPSVDIPIVVDLCNDANEPVPTTITPLEGVPGARRVTFKVPLRGVYTCNVHAAPAPPTAPGNVDKDDLTEPIDVSGSPFLIQAELASGAPPLPSSIEFIDFIKGMPLSVFRGASDETSGAHQQRLDARLKTLGLKVTPVPLDADCQFYAVAEQLFRRGVEQAPFIRSMATWWLRLNGDYSLANGTRLDEQVPEGTWDSYVDQIEDGGWGDHVTLIAIAEVFGTSVRIVSSVEGDSFVTEIQPRVLKRTRVVLLSHWLEFAYGALKATSKSRLKN
jgi:predicted acylesterase/phospholipase RssA/PII-like signaling protein